ncbi:MAG: hydroxymethylbilane synthase [Coriobacteriia bacterium]|nr:hydroxymethylbilane synthase [Coriobacteriia bacterium]
MKRTVRVGSRESSLAVAQAEIVISDIRAYDPEIDCELVTMRTTGDRNLNVGLESIGGKGVFVKELEQALLDQQIDIAVHSYKDMPYEANPDLPIVALSKREAPYDALVLPEGISELDNSRPIGSSSQRRAVQVKQLYQDVEVAAVRGNVVTRLAKLDLGEYSALLLAQAGLVRLGLEDRISKVFSTSEMVPSGSQGIIAVQARAEDNCAFLSKFHSSESEVVSLAERNFLKALGSTCTSPVGVYGELDGEMLDLVGMFVDALGQVRVEYIRGRAAEALSLGEALAKRLLEGPGATC